MLKHTDLAKNILPSSSQGKAKTNQLWEHPPCKLNASGPPVRDSKTWCKVYANQKQNVRKKPSFNKSPIKRTFGDPYEEKVLTQVEEQLMVTAGIDVAVEGLKKVGSFGTKNYSTPPQENDVSIASDESNEASSLSPCLGFSSEDQIHDDFASVMEIDDEEETLDETKTSLTHKALPKIRKSDNKTILLEKNRMCVEIYQKEMLKRLDKLIEIKPLIKRWKSRRRRN